MAVYFIIFFVRPKSFVREPGVAFGAATYYSRLASLFGRRGFVQGDRLKEGYLLIGLRFWSFDPVRQVLRALKY